MSNSQNLETVLGQIARSISDQDVDQAQACAKSVAKHGDEAIFNMFAHAPASPAEPAVALR